MKLIFTLLLLVTVTLTSFAQSPEKMSYQAIMRRQDGNLVKNSNISLKIIVRKGAANGAAVYQETHAVVSNSNGLVSLEIGTGTIALGTFSGITWENGPFFIETQVDLAGGSNYNIIGSTQLLSVPYALHAKTAERLVGSNGALISTDLSSYATNTSLALKVDKISGKGLSTEDYTTAEKTKLAALSLSSTGSTSVDLSTYATKTDLALKVDKIAGKGLSTEDYSSAEKTKLAALTGKAVIIPFTSSRTIVAADVNNVIECTTSATLTLPTSFGVMAIGDTVNLEAHNGATLTIQATGGVLLNYTANASGTFTSAAGNVRFGFLRKVNTNSYILSGQ
jgi:hypothetical protein